MQALELHALMENGINRGEILPLPHVEFMYNQVEEAVQYLQTGKHVGKVLIQMSPDKPAKSSGPLMRSLTATKSGSLCGLLRSLSVPSPSRAGILQLPKQRNGARRATLDGTIQLPSSTTATPCTRHHCSAARKTMEALLQSSSWGCILDQEIPRPPEATLAVLRELYRTSAPSGGFPAFLHTCLFKLIGK
eukprot:jgi/Botrbrau1/15866/Bobra.40_1s0050.1